MDAFAVSVTNGMCKRGGTVRIALFSGICFGLFQGLMPTLGYALGSTFSKYIEMYDHVIALVLLCYIGGKMLWDAAKGDAGKASGGELAIKELILQGIATSIDALAVGVSFAALIDWSAMLGSALLIAFTTLVISFAGALVGRKFGDILNSKAQIAGGIILIGIGIKIFVEHVFFS